MVKELEPNLADDAVTWGSNINIISVPHFITLAHEQSTVIKKVANENPGSRQGDRRKCCKEVKTNSTQTELQQPASRPGVLYMDTSPTKELFDSFSSLPSLNSTMEQQSLKQNNASHDEQLVNSLITDTTKKHLTGKDSLHHGNKKKRHKNKKEKLKVHKDITATLSNGSTHTIPTDNETTDNALLLTSSPVDLPAAAKSIGHTGVHTPYIVTQPQHSMPLTPTSSTPSLTHHSQKQTHSSDILTHHIQKQTHSSDILTHQTQKQTRCSDILTHHSQEQSNAVQQAKHWIKFEQLKAKYLPHSLPSNITAHSQKLLHSRFLVKQKLN